MRIGAWWVGAGLVLGMLACRPQALSAQSKLLEVAGGVAVPNDRLAARHNTGPLVRVSLSRRDRVVRPRGDLEFFTLGTRTNVATASATGRYSAASASASLLVGRFTARVTPYVLVGIGATSLHLAGSSASFAPTLRAGLGIRYETYDRAVFVEGGQQAILTDRGIGDYSFAVVSPVVIGASFRWF